MPASEQGTVSVNIILTRTCSTLSRLSTAEWSATDSSAVLLPLSLAQGEVPPSNLSFQFKLYRIKEDMEFCDSNKNCHVYYTLCNTSDKHKSSYWTYFPDVIQENKARFIRSQNQSVVRWIEEERNQGKGIHEQSTKE